MKEMLDHAQALDRFLTLSDVLQRLLAVREGLENLKDQLGQIEALVSE